MHGLSHVFRKRPPLIYGVGEGWGTAFTEDGIENPRQNRGRGIAKVKPTDAFGVHRMGKLANPRHSRVRHEEAAPARPRQSIVKWRAIRSATVAIQLGKD